MYMYMYVCIYIYIHIYCSVCASDACRHGGVLYVYVT